MQITDDIATEDATVVLTLSLLLSRLGRVQISLTLLSLLHQFYHNGSTTSTFFMTVVT